MNDDDFPKPVKPFVNYDVGQQSFDCRKELWVRVAVAFAVSEKNFSPEDIVIWANNVVNGFDEKFNLNNEDEK